MYANKERLGTLRTGEGRRPRLRFDVDRVAAVLATPSAATALDPAPPARRRGRPRRAAVPADLELLVPRRR